jgi:hypothetical protein
VSGSLENELLELVVAWARSWSDGDFAQYLSYYAQDFDPPGDLTLEEWQTARRSRLEKRPTMTVAPETLTVVEARATASSSSSSSARARGRRVYAAQGDSCSCARVTPGGYSRELIVDVLSDPR